MSEPQSIRLLVCGSSRFKNVEFACQMFDSVQRFATAQGFGIGAVISGPYDGIDQAARVWADLRGVRHEEMEWSMAGEVSHSFFDREMPSEVLMHHPAFQQCAKKMQQVGAQLVAAFPGADGRLGCTARNLATVAEVSGLGVLRANDLMDSIRNAMASRAEQPRADALSAEAPRVVHNDELVVAQRRTPRKVF